jgi:hypothetical protein
MPAYNGPKRTTSRRLCVMLTPDDEARLDALRASRGLCTDTDTVRLALELASTHAQPGKPSTHEGSPSAPSNGNPH